MSNCGIISFVMMNLFQHLNRIINRETLKQVQGDKWTASTFAVLFLIKYGLSLFLQRSNVLIIFDPQVIMLHHAVTGFHCDVGILSRVIIQIVR